MNLEDIRARLIAERDELQHVREQARPSRQAVVLDQTSVGRLSRADAMQVQAMALAAERRRQIRFQRIEATLARIDKSIYGLCLRCGNEIAPARLEADLTSPLCVDCAGG
jgi:DnaK suppressor protein